MAVMVMLAEPSKLVPFMVLAVCSLVAVDALPDSAPEIVVADTVDAVKAPCTFTASAFESNSSVVLFAPPSVYPILRTSALSSKNTALSYH